MMKRIFLTLTICLAGCAQLTAVRVTDTNPNPDGLPLYGTKPILVVTGQNAKIEYIPNLSERYALQMRTFLAENNTTLSFNPNGTLSKVETEFDATGAISLVENALGRLVPELPAAGDGLAGQQTSSVRIFDFVFADDGTVSLNEIGVSVTQPIFTPEQTSFVTQPDLAPNEANGNGSLQSIPGQ